MKVYIRNIILLFLLVGVWACEFGSKTDLYLERGLDILSNKKQVNFKLQNHIEIEEVGVIRDKKEQKKVIVFMLDNKTDPASLNGLRVGMRARIRESEDNFRTEQWDFEPRIILRKKFKYFTRDIHLEEDRIRRLSVFLYRENDTSKQRIGKTLIIDNILTYND